MPMLLSMPTTGPAKLNVCLTTSVIAVSLVAVLTSVESALARTAEGAAGAQATPARAQTKSSYSAPTAKARRATVSRARAQAAARAKDVRDAQTPRFRVDEFGREVPDVRAEAAIIYNPETNEVLWADHAEDLRSIASITKVMTALVFLDSGADLSMPVTVQRSDVSRASTTYLRAGYNLTAADLLNLLLIGSDNAAARALARVSPYGPAGFIDQMNEKAKLLGLTSTRYADPSGLLAENVSSAYDLARLIAYSAADERIGGIMRKTSFTTLAGKRTISASSTNQLIKNGDIDVLGGKTGFISRSGYCLATLLRLPQTGQLVSVVVLGAKSNASRFWETRHLFNWMSTRSKSVVDAGQLSQQQN
ncbi:MAG: D-alanyl-D-alanine carboxypeptidase family protein [Vicinamibacterales bacterium]